MSDNKQTLFRFKTMRAPKTVDVIQDRPAAFFSGSSVFATAVAGKGPGVTVKEAMLDAADAFTPADEGAIHSLANGLDHIGDYVVTHPDTAEVDHVDSLITGFSTTALDTDELQTIWDNLFYQTLTMESPTLREKLIKVLIGHQIVSFFASITTDAHLRRYAKTLVVLPADLFSMEEPYTSSTTDTLFNFNGELLKHMSIAESQVKAQLGISALNDLAQYKTKFYKAYLPEETAANAAYLKSVETAVNTATPEIERDPFTGELKKVINPTIPSPTFEPKDEVDMEEMEELISDQTLLLINKLDLGDCKTFDQLEKGLSEYVQKHQNDAFAQTDFHVEKLSVNGSIVPKCEVKSMHGAGGQYMLKTFPTEAGKYKVIAVVKVSSSCVKLEAADLSIENATGDLSKFTYTNKDGIMTIDFTPNGAAAIPTPAGEVYLDLHLSDGSKLSIPWLPSAPTLNLMYHLTGVMKHIANGSTEATPFVPSGFGINRLGISEYRRVEQTLCCYVPGEVSHIENVMAREYKERSTRRLRRSEESTTQTSSRESEHLTDTSSTSRFDMQQEISDVISKSQENSRDIGFNASLSGGINIPFMGDAQFSVGGDYSSSSSSSFSQENSNSQSLSIAKEIIEKVQDRVVSKITEERTRKIVDEFEEQNRHGFDNRKGSEHISGVYRWVDKVYKNQIFNYGKRLQYEFMIPEPASFHLATKAAMSDGDGAVTLLEPRDPRKTGFGVFTPLTHAGMVTDSNYLQWAAVYGANVSAPPDEIKTVSKTLTKPDDGSPYSVTKVVNQEITLPAGYGIRRIWCSAAGNGALSNYDSYDLSVGCCTAYLWTSTHQRFLLGDSNTFPNLDRYVESIPVTVQFTHLEGGMVSVELELVRKQSLYVEWQLETFNAIVEAYLERLATYESKVAEAETRNQIITADNPKFLRRIEHTALKKSCIAYLIGHMNMGKGFIDGSTTTTTRVRINSEMDQYAAKVKFFEQAFEWELMDYLFYPFYWGDRTRWQQSYNFDNDDALFRSFLQAGMARTTLTVRPGFERAVLFYMNTGIIWSGGEMPIIGDPLYISIDMEMASPEYYIEDTWETRIPSTLTVIQAKTIALNAEGLPCYCDEDETPESIISPTVQPLAALDVFINGDSDEP